MKTTKESATWCNDHQIQEETNRYIFTMVVSMQKVRFILVDKKDHPGNHQVLVVRIRPMSDGEPLKLLTFIEDNAMHIGDWNGGDLGISKYRISPTAVVFFDRAALQLGVYEGINGTGIWSRKEHEIYSDLEDYIAAFSQGDQPGEVNGIDSGRISGVTEGFDAGTRASVPSTNRWAEVGHQCRDLAKRVIRRITKS